MLWLTARRLPARGGWTAKEWPDVGTLLLHYSAGRPVHNNGMTAWEYMIIALPEFEEPTASRGLSDAVRTLNDDGARGWEAVGMTVLGDGRVAVLCKRPLPDNR